MLRRFRARSSNESSPMSSRGLLRLAELAEAGELDLSKSGVLCSCVLGELSGLKNY